MKGRNAVSDEPHERIDIMRITEVGPNDVFVFRLETMHTEASLGRIRKVWTDKFPSGAPTMILLQPDIQLEGVYRKVE